MSGTIQGNIKATESKFAWQIPNFSKIKAAVGEYIYSPTFVCNGCCQTSSKILNLHWRMILYPSGARDDNYIAVYLENLDVVSDVIQVATLSSIALIDNLILNRIAKSMSFPKLRIFTDNQTSWGWSDFERRELILKQCSLTDTLTFSCHIYSTAVKCHEDPESDEENCSEALMNHFGILFSTGQFSDMTISVGSQKLCVHKSIVTSLSPVFRAMFDHQMKEQNESVVEIVDIEFNVMKEMLRYIYVRKVNGIEEIASDLFIAADKYQVNGLKSLCEKSLCKNLKMSNALQHLEIAVQYNTRRLKPKAIQFIIDHLKSFNDEEKFKEISSECKSELLRSITENSTASLLVTWNAHSMSCDDLKSDDEDCSVGLLEHFDMLFNTGKFSDMKIKVEEKELLIHTNIVTFFSPVFGAMIESTIEENHSENKVVEINDIEFDIMKEMLRYMYTKKVNEIEKIAGSLFTAADMYDVKGLKKFCEKSLCNNLDVHNALERLEMAVQCKMNKVKRVLTDYVAQNLMVFIDKPEFEKLSSAGKSELLSVIAEAVGNRKRPRES